MTRTQRFTLAATSLGLFMIYLDALIVNVALPAIQSDFKVGEAGLQWVVTAYSLGMAIAIMSAGTAADIYGRRKLYLAGIALFRRPAAWRPRSKCSTSRAWFRGLRRRRST
jgi:MFS family permease